MKWNNIILCHKSWLKKKDESLWNSHWCLYFFKIKPLLDVPIARLVACKPEMWPWSCSLVPPHSNLFHPKCSVLVFSLHSTFVPAFVREHLPVRHQSSLAWVLPFSRVVKRKQNQIFILWSLIGDSNRSSTWMLFFCNLSDIKNFWYSMVNLPLHLTLSRSFTRSFIVNCFMVSRYVKPSNLICHSLMWLLTRKAESRLPSKFIS